MTGSAPYLRYVNHKMRREAEQWPGADPHLFPALTGNASGQRAMTYYSLRLMMLHWLKVRD